MWNYHKFINNKEIIDLGLSYHITNNICETNNKIMNKNIEKSPHWNMIEVIYAL